MEQTGQVDAEGNKLSTNSDTSGRYHSDWLNMMYPRLKLARNLLKDDGVIFISIDDNEVANLRKVCDEIFGEENFLAEFIWKKRTGSNDSQNMVSLDHDYIVAYTKIVDAKLNGELKDSSNYKNPDNDPLGAWAKDNLTCNKTASERPNLFYSIVDPETGIEYECNPNRVWAYEKERMERNIQEGKVIFPKTGKGTPMYKRHLAELRSNRKPYSSIINTVINTIATKETRSLLGGQYFDYPKSIDLIEQLIQQGSSNNDLILDFFSGSATTAHSVMKLNAEDEANRKYILVQLPEETDEKSEAYKAGYKNICEIGKERIRRAGEKIVNSEELRVKNEELDIGFKVFKLDSSNIKAWDPESEDLEQSLFDAVNNIKPDRTQEDLLYEILLKYGLDLTLPIEELELAGKKVYVVGLGALVICLDEAITLDTVEEIAKLKEQYGADDLMRVVFRDNGFKDAEVKTNAIQILKQQGIDDVKSL